MNGSEQLPISHLLSNSALLLDTVKNDASTLQQYLADFIEALPADFAEQIDVVALQWVDQLTQVLEDLSAAFLAMSRCVDEDGLSKWASIASELKLEKVRDALAYGFETASARSQVELF